MLEPTSNLEAAEYRKPLPVITATNRPYWEAAARHEFLLQRCTVCESWIYPISVVCSTCGSQDEYTWSRPSGLATLSSWVVYRQAFEPFEADDLPYAVAEVELEEGVRMVSRLVGVSIGDHRAGMPLRVAFQDVTEDLTLVVFEAAEEL